MAQSAEKFGKYTLLEKLATGGMAEVYLARSNGANGVGKFFAVKRILPQFSENNEFIEMFKAEAKLVSNLQHSNIVSLYEFGVEKNQFFISMEFVDGRNLRQILTKMKKQGVSFSTEQVLYIIREISSGLDHAHRALDKQTGKPLNIIHRDMSPQNVMVSFEGECKIVDFGIAKAETQIESTRHGTLKGKFQYMSPEQAEGQQLDVRTDVFSLGIVLWELLANDRLFVASNEVNTLRKIRDCQIPSLRKINPNIHPELERIVMKALSRDRNFRFLTANALQRDLNKFLNRTYPDFSPADFSLFIKSLFQQEILESRRKQMEYAQAELPREELTAPRAPDQTVVVSPTLTNTENPTVTDGEESGLVNFGNEAHIASRAPPASRGASAPPPAPPTPMQSTRTETKAPPPQDIGERPRRSPVDQVRSGGFATAPQREHVVLDPASEERDQPGRPRRLTVDTSSLGQGGGYGGGTSISRAGYRGTSITRIERRSRFQQIFATVVLVMFAGAAIAGFLWYQANPDKALATINAGAARLGLVAPQPVPSRPAESSEDFASKANQLVTFITTPSGADVRVNGEKRGATPVRLDFPLGSVQRITITLQGREIFNEDVKITDQVRQISPSVRLDGYVDIIVLGGGQIYVDGKLVAKSPPVKGHAVPADKEVEIRVWDPTTQAEAIERVRVPANETRTVTLRPSARVERQ